MLTVQADAAVFPADDPAEPVDPDDAEDAEDPDDGCFAAAVSRDVDEESGLVDEPSLPPDGADAAASLFAPEPAPSDPADLVSVFGSERLSFR